jgi:hypothetical protein
VGSLLSGDGVSTGTRFTDHASEAISKRPVPPSFMRLSSAVQSLTDAVYRLVIPRLGVSPNNLKNSTTPRLIPRLAVLTFTFQSDL